MESVIPCNAVAPSETRPFGLTRPLPRTFPIGSTTAQELISPSRSVVSVSKATQSPPLIRSAAQSRARCRGVLLVTMHSFQFRPATLLIRSCCVSRSDRKLQELPGLLRQFAHVVGALIGDHEIELDLVSE